MKLLVVWTLLSCVCVTLAADSCTYTCYRRVNTCSGWWWGRDCSYRSVRSTCTRPTVPGVWGPWTETNREECSATCGSGNQTVTFQRQCNSPSPNTCASQCNGLTVKTELQACSTQECPVDGGWSDWDDWQDYDECSALCGGGTKDQWRMRRCDNPAPAFGGSDCQGPERQNGTVNCNTDSCGDRCPDGANTYIANTNNADRYYQCVHGVARLMDCADGTVWDQTTSTCVLDLSEPDCADGTVWDEATQMCVHDTSNPDCADGTVWDEAAQMCVHDTSNPDCADGTVWDEATEMCVHDTSNPDCADGTVWDEATASCVHDSPQGCDSSVPIQPHQDCTKYVICSHGNAIVMPCSPGMRYNDVIKVCDWADNVSCDN